MAANKTVPTGASVKAYLDGIEDEQLRRDARAIAKMMQAISGEKPAMWGPSIVGFGSYHYVYESGREGDAARLGFSARKTGLVLYIVPGFERHDALLARLGKHSTGKSCLYIKRLSDVDEGVLRALVGSSLAHMDKAYPRSSAERSP